MSSSMSYPYRADYNDHFETPLRAYQDVAPLLDLVAPPAPSASRAGGGRRTSFGEDGGSGGGGRRDAARASHVLYDPYYCAGRTRELLGSLGFARVAHEKRDFYADVAAGLVPAHDTLVTNPPYSADHKERCIEYAVESLRAEGGGGRPFFLLLPSYVALREYWGRLTSRRGGGSGGGRGRGTDDPADVFYLVPEAPYEYDHPEGTGHGVPPFSSLWFCGARTEQVEAIRDAAGADGSVGGGRARIAWNLRELQARGVVRTGNRSNPRQRRRRREERAAAAGGCGGGSRAGPAPPSVRLDSGGARPQRGAGGGEKGKEGKTNKKRRKKNRGQYRDSDGVRKKKRF